MSKTRQRLAKVRLSVLLRLFVDYSFVRSLIFKNAKNQRPYKRIINKQTKQNAQTHFRTPFCRAHGLVAAYKAFQEQKQHKTKAGKTTHPNGDTA